MKVPIKNIPYFDSDLNVWSTKSFSSQEEMFSHIMENNFKEPGEYKFNGSTTQWNALAKRFTEKRSYESFVEGSNEFWEFWDFEEMKSRLGVFWKSGDIEWYLTRDYYFLLNFCPIINKEQGNIETFTDIRDVQYHMSLYEKLAELSHLHSATVKRRQILYSYTHVAKCINFLWFEKKKAIKILASDDSYINKTNGDWKIISAYKNHINKYIPAWYRSFTPSQYPEIQQIEKFKDSNGNWQEDGNESTLSVKTLKTDATTAVGGPGFYYFHEEGGIAPKAAETLLYLDPALTIGPGLKSGSFAIGGSVGDLDDCKPLKDFILDPKKYEILAVPTKWYDKTGIIRNCGLFIPTQYGMIGAMDEFGNSLPEKALEILDKQEVEWRRLSPEQYAIKRSQNPRTIEEAFAWRKVSKFNIPLIERRQEQILILEESKKINPRKGILSINKSGAIILTPLSSMSSPPEEMKYPIDPECTDKRGFTKIYEDYDENCSYYAGVDSVEANITTTSPSIFSIVIYKRGHTIIDITTGNKRIVKGKVVAVYNGRHDDGIGHNEQGLLLLRMYKAVAACERNKPNFINYCRSNGYSHLIARRKELPFHKDIDTTAQLNDDFGVYKGNSGDLEREFIRAIKEYLESVVDKVYAPSEVNGELSEKVVRTIKGVDYVDDYWILEEIKLYNDDDNFDRFISFALAICFGVAQELSFEKKVYEETEAMEKKKNVTKSDRNLLGSFSPNNKQTKKKRLLI